MFKFIFTLVLTIPIFGQCVGTGCPGTGGSGGVSSVSGTSPITGTVTSSGSLACATCEVTGNKDAASGYAGLDSGGLMKIAETPLGAVPVYACTTSAYSDPTYTCSTGASLSTIPASGTLISITFNQACSPTASSIIEVSIDSLPVNKLLLDATSTAASIIPVCTNAGSQGLFVFNKINSGNYNLHLVGQGIVSICGSTTGIQYNNGQQPACTLSLSFDGTTFKTLHLAGRNFSPSIAAGLGAGTSPTVSLGTNSNDIGGQINITTGTAPTTGIEATITFGAAYGTAPFCTLTANNAATALVNGTAMIYPSTTITTLVMNSGTVALTLSTAYSWIYHCSQ